MRCHEWEAKGSLGIFGGSHSCCKRWWHCVWHTYYIGWYIVWYICANAVYDWYDSNVWFAMLILPGAVDADSGALSFRDQACSICGIVGLFRHFFSLRFKVLPLKGKIIWMQRWVFWINSIPALPVCIGTMNAFQARLHPQALRWFLERVVIHGLLAPDATNGWWWHVMTLHSEPLWRGGMFFWFRLSSSSAFYQPIWYHLGADGKWWKFAWHYPHVHCCEECQVIRLGAGLMWVYKGGFRAVSSEGIISQDSQKRIRCGVQL